VNLVEYVFQAARDLGRWSEPAILYEGQQLTYEQIYSQVRKFGRAASALGVEPGDRVAIVAADCPGFVVAFLGAAAMGAVAVPVSTMLTPPELEYILGHCGAKAAFITSDQLGKVQSIRSALPRLENVLLFDGEGARGFGEALSGVGEAEVQPVSEDAPAFILYTSGSTGQPKGAVHIHRNLPYTVETYGRRILDLSPQDRLFSSSRLFFAYGLGNSLSFPLSAGATTILCKDRPRPEVIAGILVEYRPTIFFAVPAVYQALLEHASRGGALETGSVKFCVSAGEKLPARIIHEWKELTGLDIFDGIGSTEMLHIFVSNSRGDIRSGSTGRVVPGYEAKLVGPDERVIDGAGTGALWVKGLSASPNYWAEPEKTAETMRGGWVRTGDLYRRDEEGYYWFEGRADDVFKIKGLWVSPIEVEDSLLSCPEVLEAAVVPRADRDGLNTVVAYVVFKEGEGGGDDPFGRLRSRLSALLPAYKRPAEFRRADSLPRTATGKIQRFKLRDELAGS
jgi:benzoate-CoA ligase family protein